MSQPPQPPNQPPQDGFGAPQDPPPGGFGAPQQPGTPPPPPATAPSFDKAPGPGYGYPGPGQNPPGPGTPPPPPPGQPTAPNQPPPPGAPYGYPQGQPQPPTVAAPGYGYPAQPPGPGYPGAPTAPMPAARPADGRRTRLAIIVSAAVAIALIIGGGAWYSSTKGDGGTTDAHGSTQGTDGKGGEDGGTGGKDAAGKGGSEKVPANTAASVLFQLPAPAVPKNEVWNVSGSWLKGGVYAKSGVNKIVGYDADSGTEKWTLPLDGMTCAGSPEVTENGIAAVVYEESKRSATNKYPGCSKISAFDLNTGEKLWTSQVSLGDRKARYEEVSISGDTVAVGGGTSGGGAFDIKSGKSLWSPSTASTCKDVGYRGGEQLVAVRTCGSYDDPRLEVQLLNPADGKPKWSYKLPDGIDNAKVISSKPVVFGVDSGDITASGVTDVFSLDDQGKLRAKIALPDGKYEHDCDVNKVHDCHAIAVGNDKLYVPTKEHKGSGESYSMTNEIIAFSLATGKGTGDRLDGGDGYRLFPIRMDGGNIIAYKDGPYDKGAQVVSIDGSNLKETKLLETPADQAVHSALSSMVPKSAELLYGDGRLFFGKELISKPYSADDKVYTAIGFGAK